MPKPRISVHKFTSCDGCQLAFLTAGEALLTLSDQVEWVHFAEAGPVDPQAKVDITFIEGSVSTPHERERILQIRRNSQYLITIGACATAGGLQALRNSADHPAWIADVYASPQHIASLATSTAISQHVKVDTEIWGCPVNTEQVMSAIRSLLSNAKPQIKQDSVCVECKRQGYVCVLVSQQEPCLGPVTQTGCGALCPSLGRGCYGCYGPQQNPQSATMAKRFQQLGLSDASIARQFLHINNQAKDFAQTGQSFKGIAITTAPPANGGKS